MQNSVALLCAQEIELLHDVHERLSCSQAIQVCQSVEPYRPFFMEDPLPPKQLDHFKQLRAQTSVPLAMGVSLISLRKLCKASSFFLMLTGLGQELFVNVNEYLPLIRDRLIDFIRVQ